MKVRLLFWTPEPLRVVYVAARTCYSQEVPVVSLSDNPEKMENLISRLVFAGHLSVLEHVSLTFSIEGISRACSHQLVRHRIASYSQQSQRYVSPGMEWVVPPEVSKSPEALALFSELTEKIEATYKALCDMGIPKEDARYVLPNATPTVLVMSMNFRELLHASSLRLCNRAQWEIQELFQKIRGEIYAHLGSFWASLLKPKCEWMGYCTEEEGCGAYPRKA